MSSITPEAPTGVMRLFKITSIAQVFGALIAFVSSLNYLSRRHIKMRY
jgi:hypothetical protein